MIILFTDFGADDIYVGQIKARMLQTAPKGTAVIDLLHSVPDFDPHAGAHLLAALHTRFPEKSVFFAVIDPSVGSERGAAAVEADGQWFVGPDNGLLSVVAARANRARTWRISWRPDALSPSFHGRDLFAPVAAGLAGGVIEAGWLESIDALDVNYGADDLAQIIYIDHYGNAMTGLRASNVPRTTALEAMGRRIPWARVFSDVPAGSAFWYENSIGLVEVAVNRGNAAAQLGLGVGDEVSFVD